MDGEAEPAAGKRVVEAEAAGMVELMGDDVGVMVDVKRGGEVKMLNASGCVQTTEADRRVGIKS